MVWKRGAYQGDVDEIIDEVQLERIDLMGLEHVVMCLLS